MSIIDDFKDINRRLAVLEDEPEQDVESCNPNYIAIDSILTGTVTITHQPVPQWIKDCVVQPYVSGTTLIAG